MENNNEFIIAKEIYNVSPKATLSFDNGVNIRLEDIKNITISRDNMGDHIYINSSCSNSLIEDYFNNKHSLDIIFNWDKWSIDTQTSVKEIRQFENMYISRYEYGSNLIGFQITLETKQRKL